MGHLSNASLDSILGLQLTVAWAGEKACDPPRLGYWDTDLIDEAAGGDLFARLLPRTAAWAGLQTARDAAIRVDLTARSRLPHSDRVRTLFHFGFEFDEALKDRLEHHKRHQHVPYDILGPTFNVAPQWDSGAFERYLSELARDGASNRYENTAAGRRLKKLPDSPTDAARLLASALLPLSDTYPLVYVEVK